MNKPVRKKVNTHYEVSEGWAVSYSDLLMVLMSFFILYFNIDGKKSDHEEFQKIILTLENDPTIKKEFKTLERIPANNSKKDIINGISNAFGNKKAKENINKEITINLPKNIYNIGEYSLNKSVQKNLDHILNLISDKKRNIDFFIIGHTDNLKFKKNKEVLNSNLALSSMRAVKAVEYMLKKGINSKQIFVQGLDGQPRNTRSLSIRMVAR